MHKYFIVPIKRVCSLNQSQNLDHPNYQPLKSCQLKVQVVLAELVNDENDLENNSQPGHDIVKLGHHVDIVDCSDSLINQRAIVSCYEVFFVVKQVMHTLQSAACQIWIVQYVLGHIRPGVRTIGVYFCHSRTVHI